MILFDFVTANICVYFPQCCGSGMFIPDPRSRILIFTHPGSRIPDLGSRISDPGSRIPDPKTATKESEKKLYVKPFYVATKFNKIVNYFSFEVLKKKNWAKFQRTIELFTKKIVKKLFKIWSWDPGSRIWDPEKTHSGSRIQGSKRHQILDPGSRIPDPGSGSATLIFSIYLCICECANIFGAIVLTLGLRLIL